MEDDANEGNKEREGRIVGRKENKKLERKEGKEKTKIERKK